MDKNTPFISVVMPAYKETPEMLMASIESILAQTYPHFEFIIVLDNPDNALLLSLIADYAKQDSRIVVLRNEKNLGVAKSVNRGIDASKGTYIARMDADDISFPNRLEAEIAKMLEGGFHLVHSHRINIDEEGNVSNSANNTAMRVYAPAALPYGNFITQPTVLMEKAAFYTVGGYRAFWSCEDYDLWLRLFSHGYKFGVITDPLLYYRVRPDSLTRNHFETYWSDKFCRILYQKEKNGPAVFSEENLTEYLRKHGGDSVEKRRKFNLAYGDLTLVISHIAHHNLGAGLRKLLAATIKKPKMFFIFMGRIHRLMKMRKIPIHQSENKPGGLHE